MSQRYSDRVKCSSCANGSGPHGCTDCLNTGIDPGATAGGIEQMLNDAYAEGRKDEREAILIEQCGEPPSHRLVPIEPPDSLAAHLTDYGLGDNGMSERDRSVVRERLRKRWAAILAAIPDGVEAPHGEPNRGEPPMERP